MKQGQLCVFKDEWEERDRFSYATYEVVTIRHNGSTLSVKEITTGIVYVDVKRKELLTLN